MRGGRGRCRRATRAVLAGLLLAGPVALAPAAGSAATRAPATTSPAKAAATRAGPFAGLGTWIDAYDYAPTFQPAGGPPPVTPASVDYLAALGVRTLYLQATKDDSRSPEPIVDRPIVGELLERAHRAGVRVVAWYLPTWSDPDADFAHLEALHAFRSGGQRFDAIALDIEWIQSVPEHAERNRRVVALARRLRALVGRDALVGAIVYPAVQLEVVNPVLWPSFPYRGLAEHVDVWMPMAYWTFRNGDYRDAERYVGESIRRLRRDLDDEQALVHPIGGIGDLSTAADYEGMMRAVSTERAVGWSVYDLNTTFSSLWPRLRPAPVGAQSTTSSTTPSTTRAKASK